MNKNTKIFIAIVCAVIVVLIIGAIVFFPRTTHKHVTGEISYNEAGHWYKCANGCDHMLDEKGEEISIPLSHDFSGEIFYVADNGHAFKCTTCEAGGFNGIAFSSTPCNFVWQKEGPNSTEGTHYMQCTECGHIDETTRGNHIINSDSSNHLCSICGLVNVFADSGEPDFHYFEDGFETRCSVEGCDVVLKVENGFIDNNKYYVKLNPIPYMDPSGEYMWNSTPIMIIQACSGEEEFIFSGQEIAVAPLYDEETRDWIFDFSQYQGQYMILRIENVAGFSDGIEISQIFKNE